MRTSENTTVKIKPAQISEKSIALFVPVELVATGNLSEHWTKRAKRKKAMKTIVKALLSKKFEINLPCVVTLTRISKRDLDFDNLVYSFKDVRDALADVIVANAFNLPCIDSKGQYDGDPRIQWRYGQGRGNLDGFNIEILQDKPCDT